MVRRFPKGMQVLIAVCTLLCVGRAFGDTEADWIYEAGEIIQRFEATGGGDLAPQAKELAYYELLEAVSEFAQEPVESLREKRGRNVFNLLMAARIEEQLGNAKAAKRHREAYGRERDALPPQEKLLFVHFFERVERTPHVYVPRVCEIEARGTKVRFRAVNYNIKGLLEKLMAATGESDRISPEISGLVTHEESSWSELHPVLGLLLPSYGLLERGTKEGYEIVVRDPLYMASLAERVAGRMYGPRDPGPQGGIETGFLIIAGRYIPPPYQVHVETKQDRCGVYVNGLPIGRLYKLTDAPEPPPVSLPASGQFAKAGPLSAYAAQQFYRDVARSGRDKARRALAGFLKGQKIVQSFTLRGDDKAFVFIPTTGPLKGFPYTVSLHFGRGRDPASRPARPSPEHDRREALAKARGLRDRVDQTLREGGLIIAPKDGPVVSPANRSLLAVCTALQESELLKERVRKVCFPGALPTPEASQWAWEIFLKLRHRELILRLRDDPTPH